MRKTIGHLTQGERLGPLIADPLQPLETQQSRVQNVPVYDSHTLDSSPEAGPRFSHPGPSHGGVCTVRSSLTLAVSD